MTMPLSGLRLVEASAGTGKTFSLAGLYLRLLVEKRLDVRDILVVTFTRAATQELRDRIRTRITRAARLAADRSLANASGEDRIALEILEAAAEPAESLARRLRDAAVRMDEATITTIHGFCQQALAENAFDSAVAFDRGDPVDDRVLLAECAADYWRREVIGRPPEAARAFMAHWPEPRDLAAGLGWILDTPHLKLAGPAPDAIPARVAQARADWAAVAPLLQARLEAIEQAGEFHAGRALGKAVKAAGGVAALFRAIASGEQPLPGALSTSAITQQLTGEARKTGVSPQWTGAVDALLEIPGLERLAAVHTAAVELRTALQQRKRERRVHSFNDMIQSLHGAITDPRRGPALARALRQRWPWALVDEFQDTDPLQYAILRAIYRGHEGAGMIMIGDPKQAIYGFRGGDVFAYLQAAEDTEGVYSLDTNFRSTAPVLKVIEALFRLPGERPFMLPEIAFLPVRAGRAQGDRDIELEGQPLPALTLWTLEPGSEGKPWGAGVARQQLAGATIAQIQRLLDGRDGARVREGLSTRPLAARDICVLVNTNAEAAQFQAALARAGLPAACLHQSSVFASVQAEQVQRVLEAAAAPADPRRLRAALVTELFGLRLGDLLQLVEDDAVWQDTAQTFQQGHERWVRGGVLAMLEPWIQSAAARLLRHEDGERRVTNWLHLAERLQQAETETFGMAGLIRWLAASRESVGDGDTAEEAQLRLESDENLVRIATVHKVKGLQFPVVMLPYAPLLGTAGARFDRPDQPPFRYHEADGGACLDPGIGQDLEHAPRAIRERRAEAMRLLYVALTRAEQAIYLPWGWIQGAQNGGLAWLFHQQDGAPDAAWQTKKEHWGPWFTGENVDRRVEAFCASLGGVVRCVPVAEIAAKRPFHADPTVPLGSARETLPEPRSAWQMFSYSSLVRGEGAGPAAASGADDESCTSRDSTPVDLELGGLSGAGFGSAVHDILEAADFARWPIPGAALGASETALVAEKLLRRGIALPEGERGRKTVGAVSGLVSRCLHTPLPGIGPLAAVPPRHRLAEMGFALRLGGETTRGLTTLLQKYGYTGLVAGASRERVLLGLMQGFIDLVVERDGRYWVLDYKSNHLGSSYEDYAPSRLADAVRHGHYDLQYLVYVTALHRHLALRLPGYDPERHLGGVQYLFLRGMNGRDAATGVFIDHPSVALVRALDRLLDNCGAAA
jgi:exodeoxyribonuclease V beta subunit